MKQRIVFASGNAHKLKEMRELLPEYEILSCSDLGFSGDIVEDGESFYENALIKAKTVSDALGLPALADDSGLCVDALGGEPGIFSARYSGDGISEHNNSLLLKNLKCEKNRKARFVCVLVYYKPKGEIISAEGVCEGKITEEPFGENGFGYDPIFYSDELKKPLGIATSEEKNSVSHRAKAIKALREKLK